MKKDKIVDIQNYRKNTVFTQTSLNKSAFTDSAPSNFTNVADNDNIESVDCECMNCEENFVPNKISINDYIELKSDIKSIKTSLDWIKWVIPLLITISIFVIGNIVTSIKENNNMQYQMLDKKLDAIKELNSMQIQRDVAVEIKKQTK